MTNYSRTTLRELKKRYLNILKKCLLANLMAFSFMLPAGAETASEDRLTNSGEKTYTQGVTFKDLDLVVSVGNSYGGAISNSGSITFGGLATFEGNSATATDGHSYGGAISNSGSITFGGLATFEGNSATATDGHSYGGAIYNQSGSVVFKDTDNNAETPVVPNITYGMTFKGDTLFTGNKAESETGSSLGGVIHNSGYMLLAGDNTFGGYQTDENGEYVLDSEGNKISLGNEAKYGGAIYNTGGKKEGDVIAYGMTLGKSTFMGNTALSYGGAIYNDDYMNFTDDALFEGNGSSSWGGAIFNTGGKKEGDVIAYGMTFGKSTFMGNTALSRGGVIYNSGYMNFTDETLFEGNGSSNQGGAIYNTGYMNFTDEALFEGNTSSVTGGNSNGGAIYNYLGTITFSGLATFDGNSAIATGGNSHGGAIRNDGSNAVMSFKGGTLFTGNKAESETGNSYGGAIHNSGGSVVFEDTDNNAETPTVPNITYGMTFKGDTLFIGNKAESETGTSYGGAIYNPGYMLLAGENTFGGYQTDENGEYLLDSEGNKISLGNEAKQGGAIYNTGGKKEGDVIAYGMTLGKSTFMGNTALSHGGAIWNSGYMNFTDEALFEGNEASREGGAIRNSGTITFGGLATFEGNTSSATDGNANGGAIFNYLGTITFGELVTFERNTSSATGGNANGGAIRNEGANAVLGFKDEAQFKNNTATATAMEKADGTLVGGNSYGGAIYNYNNASITFDALATFEGNSSIATGGNAHGGAIRNELANAVLGFKDEAQFKNNRATATAMEKADGTLAGGSANGGAIFNYQSIEFDALATFEGNSATATGGRSSGGAINNSGAVLTFNNEAQFKNNTAKATAMEKADGTLVGGNSLGGAISNNGSITFDALATFEGNTSSATGGDSFGGAIRNELANTVLTFNDEALFKNNTATAPSMVKADGTLVGGNAYGGAIHNHNNAIINFNNSFTFTNNKTISKGVETLNDIYNSGTINFNHGVDKNGVALVGSLDGRIANDGIINKTGAGTLILGDEMVNSGTGTFNQSAGLTIAHTEHFLTGTNNITGGELRVHGANMDKLKATVSNGAMLTYLTTNAAEQTVGLGGVTMNAGILVLGAYTTAQKQVDVDLLNGRVVSYTDDKGTEDTSDDKIVSYLASDKLFTSNSIDRANYALNGDIAGAGKVTFKDSDIKLGANSYTGVYEIGATNTIDMKDNSATEKTVSFTNLTGEGAKLALDVIFIKETDGSVAMTADKLTVTGSNYEFGGIELNWVGKDLLNTWVDDMALDQDGNMNPTIVHTATILSGGASLKSGSETFLSTASPYSYMVSIGAQTLTVSASKLAEDVTPLEYLVNYAGDSTLQMVDSGSGASYSVGASETLNTLTTGTKAILGASDDASESVIEGVGQNLFVIDKADTELEMKDLTITEAGTAIDNQKGKVTLENVVIKETVGDTALKNGAEMTLKDVSVDKGVVNSGKLTMSGNNALSTLTNNGETTVEGGKLSVTTLGGAGTLTMNGAELDSTNIATNNTIVSNGMTVSDRLSTLSVKSLEVKDGTTLDLNLAMTTADKIKNEGDMIANKDLSVGALEGTGTLTVNNATLNVADKFATTNKVVSNNMVIGENVTSEIHFADLEIKDNTTLDIKTLQATANTVTVGENATLGITLKNLDEYGTMKADEIIAKEDSKVHLTLGDDFAGGVFDVFKGTKGSGDLELVHNNVYNVVEVSEGKYSFMTKDTEALQESLGATKEEVTIADAMTKGTSTNEAFNKMQSEMLIALQSLETDTVAKAKKALSAVGSKEQPIEQSVASEHLVALQNVVQAELHDSTVGHSGGEESPRAKVYIKGLYDRTKSSQGEGFRARSKGAVLGVQSEVTEDLTLGVGYATSQTTAKEDLRRTEVDTNTGFISAHYQPNAWWVSGLATFSRGEYEEEKQILSSMGKATYDVDSWGAQVMTGYDIKLDNAIITPEVGLRYLSVKQEGYTDTLGTTVSGTQSDYLTALVGVKGTWDMGAIRPTAGVTVGYDIISDDVSALNTLANGASYTVNGEALDRLSTTVTTGIEADLGERTTLKLEYSGTYRKEYVDHSGMIKFELRF